MRNISSLTGVFSLICFVPRPQGQLTEGLDVVDYLMEQANVVPRMNPLILSTDRQYLDFTANPGDLRCLSQPFPTVCVPLLCVPHFCPLVSQL